MNESTVNNTPNSESERKEKKVRFAGVATQNNIADDIGNATRVESNIATTKTNEIIDATSTPDTEMCKYV